MILKAEDSKTKTPPTLTYHAKHLFSPAQFARAAEQHDMMPLTALAIRRRYLEQQTQIFKNLYLAYDQIDPFFWWWVDHATELVKVINYIKNYKQPTGNEITSDMIERARQYPIESLIEFTRGTAIAFCHNDKRPSLSWDKQHNRAHCFPCGKSYNPIDVLVKRDNIPFYKAVRMLQG